MDFEKVYMAVAEMRMLFLVKLRRDSARAASLLFYEEKIWITVDDESF